MNEQALRTILLIQAIEETDRIGDVLPMADRAEATRTAMGNGPSQLETQAGAPLSSATEWFLTRRAEALVTKLRERSPGVDHVLAVAAGVTWINRVVLLAGFAIGVLLALADGHDRIDILGFPILGLLIWNLLVYVLLISRTFRPQTSTPSDGFWFGRIYARWARGHADTLLGHSTRFYAPLAPGLRRFAADWWDVATPLFILRARRLLHLAAVLVAVGLIVGLYALAFITRYPAGWQSSLLGPDSVHVLLVVLYGPASALSGIPIPSTEEVASLRWVGASGGGPAFGWIHLIALTASFYVVVPRLIAAAVCTVRLWRLSHRLVPPPPLSGYARMLLETLPPEST